MGKLAKVSETDDRKTRIVINQSPQEVILEIPSSDLKTALPEQGSDVSVMRTDFGYIIKRNDAPKEK